MGSFNTMERGLRILLLLLFGWALLPELDPPQCQGHPPAVVQRMNNAMSSAPTPLP